MKDLMTSVPGIDEAMAFAELMKMVIQFILCMISSPNDKFTNIYIKVQDMQYSTIVFDTAPTGHTLRLLSFPKTMESAISKLLALKVLLFHLFLDLFSQIIIHICRTVSKGFLIK